MGGAPSSVRPLWSHGLNGLRAGLCLLALTLTGWLHVIWNGEPRFMLIDDRGMAVRLVIAPELDRAIGGARSFDRQRVVVAGDPVDGNPNVLRVTMIELKRETP